MLVNFGFLREEASWKMENNEEALFKFHFASLFLLIFHVKLFRFIMRGFMLHLQACFDIVYLLVYIVCEKAFFYSQFGSIFTIVNFNQSQQRPNFFLTSFI